MNNIHALSYLQIIMLRISMPETFSCRILTNTARYRLSCVELKNSRARPKVLSLIPKFGFVDGTAEEFHTKITGNNYVVPGTYL